MAGPLSARLVVSGLGLALVVAAGLTGRAANAQGESSWWRESFDRSSLDFVDPFHHDGHLLSHVYSVERDPDGSFLHALHDETSARTPAMHFGKAFTSGAPPLERVAALRWRWRVERHPDVSSDPWEDVAASIYVVLRTPSLLHGGRGFKLGWLAKPGPDDTYQHGLLQIPIRHDAAGPEWHSESVDLCALYRRTFGPCEGEHVLYVGVVTDADGTRSVSEADYDDFDLVATP